MNAGQTLFAQLMDFVPWKTFGRIVTRYQGDHGIRRLKCNELFRILAFAQLTGRTSLRDIQVCLSAQAGKLYHMGLRQSPSRSGLSDALSTRDWRIFYELAQRLIVRARRLYAEEPLRTELDNTVYALDATTIDLCLSVFHWASFRQTKAAIKLHTLLDLRGSIPAFIRITHGKIHDVNALDWLFAEVGAFYVVDRAYLDFYRLYRHHQAGAFFVTRAKVNLDARRVCSAPVDRTTGLICDQRVALNGYYARRRYPDNLRRIRFKEPETGKTLIFLTNNTGLSPETICALYKGRWQVELFFKWIKQHLRIQRFYDVTENAVKAQIWAAVSAYLLVAIARKEMQIEASMYNLRNL